MAKFYITCDSSCDLPRDFLTRNNILFIPMKYTIDDKEYADELLFDSKNIFYNALKKGATCHTGSYNEKDILDLWDKTGEPILHISLSSGLSNCYEHALMAQKEAKKKVLVLDSLMASLGVGMLIIRACELRDKDLSLEEAYEELNRDVLKLNTIYTTDNLESFYKSGRIKKNKYLLGKLLHINPILKVDREGKLYIHNKTHGKKKAENEIIEEIKNTVIDPSNQTLYVCHSNIYDEAKDLAEKIKDAVGFKDIYITSMGPTISAHTGLGLKSYFYFGKERNKDEKEA